MDHSSKAMELTAQLLTLTNTMGKEDEIAEAICKTIMNDHRTLQQSYWRVMNKVITKYGEQAEKDARNEGAVQSCKALTPVVAEQYLPLI